MERSLLWDCNLPPTTDSKLYGVLPTFWAVWREVGNGGDHTVIMEAQRIVGTWRSDSPLSLDISEAEETHAEAEESLCIQNCNCIGLIQKQKGGRKARIEEEGDGL